MSVSRPNILWLQTDEQRVDSLGCYGSPWARTPNLDRLAREGTLFENALTPSPVCLPARASLKTGLYPRRTGIWFNNGSQEKKPLPLLTHRFEEAGYATASFGMQHYRPSNRAFRTEEYLAYSEAVHAFRYNPPHDASKYGVVQYPTERRPWILGGTFPDPIEKTNEAIAARRAMEWLDAQPADRPWLLRVTFNAPHTPVSVPAPFDRLIPPESVRLPPQAEGLRADAPPWIRETLHELAGSFRLNDEQIRKARAYYYGQVAFVDSLFGALLDRMTANGRLENTVVALVADHGAHLGDYGLFQKQTFYEPVLRVPHLFWGPGRVRAGARIRTPVSTASMLATLLEIAGIEVPPGLDFPSLAAALAAGDGPAAAPVFSEFTLGSIGERASDRLVMVRDGNWKLSLCCDPDFREGALYNLAEDPFEAVNLCLRTKQAQVRAATDRLTGLIGKHLRSHDAQALSS